MDDLRNLPPAEIEAEDAPEWQGDVAAEARSASPRRRGRRWYVSRAVAAAIFVFILVVGWLTVTAPLSKSLQPISPPRITLLAADGTPIARNGAMVEAPVEVRQLPDHVVQAFIAIEDRRFYSHWGIDPRAMARALWSNMTTGRTQGGSTISQQLAKFTFLSSERSLGRKAREVLIAFWLEAWLSKDEILQRYLSNAYFGDNAYGLRAASLHYFRRQPEKLGLGQAAMLAGLMKAPSALAPTQHYDLAEKRMRLVLQAMVDAGYLKPAEAAAVSRPRLNVRAESDLPTGTYFADWAVPQARGIDPGSYAAQTYTTTLDARLQAAARRAIARAPLGKAQVALVAMHPNGEVVAMVGGRDYAGSPFNRATQARRQPGSTFKLFVYLAALEKGWKPGDLIDNTQITTGSYRPENGDAHYSPTIRLEDAFAQSSNVAAVRLFQKVGDRAVIDVARSLGVTSPLPPGDPSMALGSASMTLLELTSAYAGIAGNRFPVRPTAFPAAKEGWFDGILGRRHSLSDANHAAIERMLRGVVDRGTGRAARLRAVNYGKTGTSQENRDALFVGYAGDLVVGVWVGNDDNAPLKGVSGGSIPARIWRDFMRQALREGAMPEPRIDPGGPVRPLDLPSLGEIPLGDLGNLHIDEGKAAADLEIGGKPIDLQLDHNGLQINGGRVADELAKGRDVGQRVLDQTRQAIQQSQERPRDLPKNPDGPAQGTNP